jgi:Domain of unknown function (DUF1830)
MPLHVVPSVCLTPILCGYVNTSRNMQIIRITDIPNTFFERTVFPGQRAIFETLPTAHLEIHTGMMASAVLEDTIPCNHLQVSDALDHQAA